MPYPRVSKKPEGQPTRGKTASNRLRRVDNFLLLYEPSLLTRSDGPFADALFVDLGYGFDARTTLESASRFRRVNPSLPVLGVEIEKERVEAAKVIRDLNRQLSQDLQLPIGWRTEIYQLQAGETCMLLPTRGGDVWGISTQNGCIQLKEDAANQNAGILMKILGLLLTAVAVTQGAPFWFDLIKKLSNPRSSGPVPATSVEQTKESKADQVEVVRAVT